MLVCGAVVGWGEERAGLTGEIVERGEGWREPEERAGLTGDIVERGEGGESLRRGLG